MAKIKSALTDNMMECYECGSPYAECHHVFFGSFQKKACTRYKLYLPLCAEHHKGNKGPHQDYEKNLEYRQMAQKYFEENIGSREEFMAEFGRNYL
ncbi:MAG: phosphoenolpyruvate carboxykinase [Eubacterium sp.]|nr:phosphoenolpyruvate carboxykinase [Eubacterium sp.]